MVAVCPERRKEASQSRWQVISTFFSFLHRGPCGVHTHPQGTTSAPPLPLHHSPAPLIVPGPGMSAVALVSPSLPPTHPPTHPIIKPPTPTVPHPTQQQTTMTQEAAAASTPPPSLVAQAQEKVPSELYISEKWDRCLER